MKIASCFSVHVKCFAFDRNVFYDDTTSRKGNVNMIIKNLEQYSSIYGKVDAILIVNKNNIIEYSAIASDDKTYLRTENLMGKNLFDIYPNLNEENSTHARVMRTGQPVVNEKQMLVERTGRSFAINTSTFPLEHDGEIIGTIDISFNLTLNREKDFEEKGRDERYTVDSIITENADMRKIKEKIVKIAQNDSPVMVIGESGVGKELIVEAIHSAGSRSSKPFISINCAAVPESLMESMLFGTVKGSFTGAENRKGIFELADGGTLFLDEINSMNIDLQAKLLKVVEDQRYMKVGGEKYINVDVRLLSAMNVEPADAIKKQKLRQDLFFRLGVLQLRVPPLRERLEDLKPLTEYYIDYFNRRMGKNIVGIDGAVQNAFCDYTWPGNVRELRNVIESAFNLAEESRIRLTDIPDHLTVTSCADLDTEHCDISRGLPALAEEFEKNVITRALKTVRSLSEAAVLLKMTRQAVKYKIDKYQIDYQRLLKK